MANCKLSLYTLSVCLTKLQSVIKQVFFIQEQAGQQTENILETTWRDLLIEKIKETFIFSVADPGFPRGGGAEPKVGGANLLFGQNFPENCMIMKEFGPMRGA